MKSENESEDYVSVEMIDAMIAHCLCNPCIFLFISEKHCLQSSS